MHKHTYILHQAVYLFAGLSVSLRDTGHQIVLRSLHGAEAGPWLGAELLSFDLFSLLVPLSDYLTPDVVYIYEISAGLCVVLAIVFMVLYHVDQSPSVSSLPVVVAVKASLIEGADAVRQKMEEGDIIPPTIATSVLED